VLSRRLAPTPILVGHAALISGRGENGFICFGTTTIEVGTSRRLLHHILAIGAAIGVIKHAIDAAAASYG
jgi:hypothetical protein